MPKPNARPTASAFGKFRSTCAKLGIKQAELSTAVGTNVSGRTWKQISEQLIAWLATRPKAK